MLHRVLFGQIGLMQTQHVLRVVVEQEMKYHPVSIKEFNQLCVKVHQLI